ncbi:DUF4198 domain-containing protein [Rheinheimera sp.]|uniref:DUF4198 domain-containing protein n=1 Tax=Rheinheimera sp. TaxID=1869214 RepID=UPI00307D499A
MKKLALASLLLASTAVSAHTLWLVPSHFVLSKTGSWVSADLSAANMTFVADKGVSPDHVRLVNPQGQVETIAHKYQGKRKSQVDVELTQEGTYRLELAGPARYFTAYKVNGERKRLMADKEARAKELPANATEVVTMQNRSRSVSFITVNKPSHKVLELSNQGLEFKSSVHPADIVAGEAVTFTFLVDGKPAAGVELDVSTEGERYRDEAGRIEFKTDASGQFSYTPEKAGVFLIEAHYSNKTASAKADQQNEGLTLTLEANLP